MTPHVVLTVAAYLGAAAVILTTARRFVLRPIRNALTELRQLVVEIRAARHVALELSGLAGATTHVVTALTTSRFQDEQRLNEMAELVTDLDAAVYRLARDVAQLQQTA